MRTFILSETGAINLSLSAFIRFGFSHNFAARYRSSRPQKNHLSLGQTSNGIMRNVILKANCGGPKCAGRKIIH